MKSPQVIESFLNRLKKDKHHRFRSWEHCYEFYRKLLDRDSYTDEDIDHACLHLGFYLASWGMYRGSTFLLQKDYRVHEGVVRELLEVEYRKLRNIPIPNLIMQENQDLLFKLVKEIMSKYKEAGVERAASGTLVTKILMGTLGCLPAFDIFFVSGISSETEMNRKISSLFQTDFSRVEGEKFKEIVKFLQNKASEFNEAQSTLQENRTIKYPVMKIIDMYFWCIGESIELDKIRSKILELEENNGDKKKLNKLKKKMRLIESLF